MLKPGIYKFFCEVCGHRVGEITLDVHETKTAFVLKLVESTVRYDAPQIDDMFRASERCVIRKNGSRHAMSFCDGVDDWFSLYPYRVGVPYAFEHIDAIHERETLLKKLSGKPSVRRTKKER